MPETLEVIDTGPQIPDDPGKLIEASPELAALVQPQADTIAVEVAEGSPSPAAEQVYTRIHGDGTERKGTEEQIGRLCPVLGRMSVEERRTVLQQQDFADRIARRGRERRKAQAAQAENKARANMITPRAKSETAPPSNQTNGRAATVKRSADKQLSVTPEPAAGIHGPHERPVPAIDTAPNLYEVITRRTEASRQAQALRDKDEQAGPAGPAPAAPAPAKAKSPVAAVAPEKFTTIRQPEINTPPKPRAAPKLGAASVGANSIRPPLSAAPETVADPPVPAKRQAVDAPAAPEKSAEPQAAIAMVAPAQYRPAVREYVDAVTDLQEPSSLTVAGQMALPVANVAHIEVAPKPDGEFELDAGMPEADDLLEADEITELLAAFGRSRVGEAEFAVEPDDVPHRIQAPIVAAEYGPAADAVATEFDAPSLDDAVAELMLELDQYLAEAEEATPEPLAATKIAVDVAGEETPAPAAQHLDEVAAFEFDEAAIGALEPEEQVPETIAIRRQSKVATSERAVPEQSVRDEAIELTVAQLARTMESTEPAELQTVQAIIERIIALPLRTELPADGAEDTADGQLEVLIAELCEAIGATYTDELAQTLVEVTLTCKQEVAEAAGDNEMVRQQPRQVGTREFLQKLLRRLRNLQQTARNFYAIGKSAIALCSLRQTAYQPAA